MVVRFQVPFIRAPDRAVAEQNALRRLRLGHVVVSLALAGRDGLGANLNDHVGTSGIDHVPRHDGLAGQILNPPDRTVIGG